MSEDVDREDVAPRWFDGIEETPRNPWRNWIQALGFPRSYDLAEVKIERQIERVIQSADDRRQDVIFAAGPLWAEFRRIHLELEDSWSYRRIRFLIWRAAAIKSILDYQIADGEQVHHKLAVTMLEFGYRPDGTLDGVPGVDFWRPGLMSHGDGVEGFSSLNFYAMLVLAVTRAAIADEVYGLVGKERSAAPDAGADLTTRH